MTSVLSKIHKDVWPSFQQKSMNIANHAQFVRGCSREGVAEEGSSVAGAPKTDGGTGEGSAVMVLLGHSFMDPSYTQGHSDLRL